MNYIEETRDRLAGKLAPGDADPALLDLYTLLVLVKGKEVTLEDVHDAWAIWRTPTRPDHGSIVPFDQLSPEVQELDRKYAEAIAAAVKEN